jgi:hypothetical protein
VYVAIFDVSVEEVKNNLEVLSKENIDESIAESSLIVSK